MVAPAQREEPSEEYIRYVTITVVPTLVQSDAQHSLSWQKGVATLVGGWWARLLPSAVLGKGLAHVTQGACVRHQRRTAAAASAAGSGPVPGGTASVRPVHAAR